ncbi:MAG: hypothetical protein ACW99F_09875 [Candidatus Hodarchaeales archaeon]
MDLASILNYYCRRIGIFLISIIPIFLAITLLLLIFTPLTVEGKHPEPLIFITTFFYLVLILIAIPFALNGFFMEKAFNTEINRIIKTGLLIRGIEGFKEVQMKIKLLYRASYSITGSVLISFLVFISAGLIKSDEDLAILARFFIFIASIGLLAISSGASILLRLPDRSAIQPGGLMKFYSPRSLPLKVDNLLSDSIIPQLDPITRIKIDEWSTSISRNLNTEFFPNLDPNTRLERAQEKILLLVYLNEYFPELLDNNQFSQEMQEIIDPVYYESFKKGKESSISNKILRTIIRDVRKEIPDVFELVQRVFVLVTENINLLHTKEEYVTITHPNTHVGNIDPFRVSIFILNLRETERKVNLQVQTSMSGLDPDDASQTLMLDSNKISVPPSGQKLKFSSSEESYDVLRLVSAILQVGDTLNLQFRPNRFGTHVLNLSLEDEIQGAISGRSVVVSVVRDPKYYAKTVGAKLLSYLGVAISFIGIGLGSVVGLFGL